MEMDESLMKMTKSKQFKIDLIVWKFLKDWSLLRNTVMFKIDLIVWKSDHEIEGDSTSLGLK